MELIVTNIGKVDHAALKIEGMTVIAGENNTGKSTIGKALFSAFNGLYQIDEKIIKAREENIGNAIRRYMNDEYDTDYFPFYFFRRKPKNDLGKLITKIAANKKMSESDFNDMLRLAEEYAKHINEEGVSKDFRMASIKAKDMKVHQEKLKDSIKKSFSISDTEIKNRIVTNSFFAEFDGQINNIFVDSEATVELKIRSNESKISIESNSVVSTATVEPLRVQAVYIDDPFIVDENTRSGPWSYEGANHRQLLKQQLAKKISLDTIDQIVADKKISGILEKINTVAGGELVLGERISFTYRPANTEESINMKNISSGLKTFLIMKQLLQNGVLQENGMLILDEPEIHLHPEWQIVLAELIVLIQKEYGMHVLLTTHSPYFLYAIEVFTGRYKMQEKSNFYLAEYCDNQLRFTDKTLNIDDIYKKLSDPFQKLENLSYE